MSGSAARKTLWLRALVRARSQAARRRQIAAAATEWLDGDSARELFTQFISRFQRAPALARPLAEATRELAAASRQPEPRAWSRRIDGTLAHAQGRTKAAIAALTEAARLFRRAQRALDEGDVWRSLIDVYARGGADRAAIGAARRAIACYRRADLRDKRRFGDVEMNLGNLHHLRDRLEEALACYARAEQAYSPQREPTRHAIALLNSGNVLGQLDRWDKARERFGAARAIFVAAGQTQYVIRADYALAGIDLLEGQLDRCVELLGQIRERASQIGDDVQAAHADLELGEALLRLNRPAPAATAVRRADRFFRRAGYAAQRAEALGVLGGAALREGSAPRALHLLRQGRALQAALGNRAGAAQLDVGIAAALLASGHPLDGLKVARRAERVLGRSSFGARQARARAVAAAAALSAGRSPLALRLAKDAVTHARRVGDARAEMAALLVQGRAEQQRGRLAEGYRVLTRAEKLIEGMRLGITREDSRLAFALDKSEVYEALIENRLALGTPRAVRQALVHAERGKARSLAERLARGTAPAFFAQRRAARRHWQRLVKVDRDLAAAEARLADGRTIPGLRGGAAPHLASLARARQRAAERLSQQDPLAAPLLGLLPTQPLAIVELLAADELVLEYVEVRGELHLFVIEKGNVTVLPSIAAVATVGEAVDRLRFHLGKGVLGEDHHRHFAELNGRACRHYLTQLHEQLLAPVISRLDGRQVRIVPHGALHGLPFHALESGGTALVDRCNVSYVPSLTVLGLLAQRRLRATGGTPIVLGVPDDAAPAIAAEVASVSQRLLRAEVRTGAHATRQALFGASAREPLLHVACHGFYAEGADAPAGLRLGDAWLDLTDVYALHRTAPLVVLSGCETGRGTVHAGDEWVGLVSGFLQAGARTVVAALWELHDESAVHLMEDFYDGLRAGLSAAAALNQAQRRARSSDPSPLRWAPFAVLGEPNTGLPARMVA